MGNTLQRVDDWTSEVIRWVHFIFIPGAVVNSVIASKDNGITEGFVLIVNGDLRSDTVLSPLKLVEFQHRYTSSVPSFILLKIRRLSSMERLRLLLSMPSMRSFLI